MELSAEPKREVAQARKGEAAVATGETAPAILQNSAVWGAADVNRQVLGRAGARDRFATAYQVGSGTANNVLD